MFDYQNCIIFLLAKAYQRAHGHFKRRVAGHGLTPIQGLVLGALMHEDALSAGEIGKRLTLDSATLSGVLDRLEAGGWILRESDPEDKRITRIYMSEKAKDETEDLDRIREESNEAILRDLSLEEQVLLRRLLRDVRD